MVVNLYQAFDLFTVQIVHLVLFCALQRRQNSSRGILSVLPMRSDITWPVAIQSYTVRTLTSIRSANSLGR